MAYTPVTYRVIVPADPEQDYAVRYATAQDIADLPASREGLEENDLYVRSDIPVPVRITVDQARTAIATGYQVSTEVTETLGIEPEIFVFRTLDGAYAHVATVYDMDNFPPTQEEAEEASLNYYRGDTAVVVRDTVGSAEDLAEYTLMRISLLTSDYKAYKATFEGDDTHTYEE